MDGSIRIRRRPKAQTRARARHLLRERCAGRRVVPKCRELTPRPAASACPPSWGRFLVGCPRKPQSLVFMIPGMAARALTSWRGPTASPWKIRSLLFSTGGEGWRSFALGNPDQTVAGDDRAFGGDGDVAKGNQLCQMRRGYPGIGR